MMRRLALVGATQLLLLFGAQPAALAQSPADTDTMAVANELYEGSRFAEAAQAYQQLVDRGIENSTVFYNLGNAYFKRGDLGPAIVNYLRAERLAPRDSDIQTNLDIARSQTIDQIEPGKDALLVRIVTFAGSRLTLNGIAVIVFATWLILVLLVIFGLYTRREGRVRAARRAAVIAGVVLVVGVISLGGRLYADGDDDRGVIVADAVDVVSGPGRQYSTEFTLNGGAEVTLIESRGNWARLVLSGRELQGWVAATAVEAVEVTRAGR